MGPCRAVSGALGSGSTYRACGAAASLTRMAVVAESTFPGRVRASLGVAITLAGVTIGMTWLYLGMRAVMEIGGACA